jgi:hypothetical protein
MTFLEKSVVVMRTRSAAVTKAPKALRPTD